MRSSSYIQEHQSELIPVGPDPAATLTKEQNQRRLQWIYGTFKGVLSVDHERGRPHPPRPMEAKPVGPPPRHRPRRRLHRSMFS